MVGDIEVTSQVNIGSEFSFTIELGQSEKELMSLPVKSIEGIRVLLVDDNKTNLEVVSKQLELWGIESVKVECAKDALSQLDSQNDGYFSIALIDMQMPKMSGDVLCQKIRENERFSPLTYLNR